MAEISVKVGSLRTRQSELSQIANKLRRLENQVGNVQRNVRVMGFSPAYRSVAGSLGNIQNSMSRNRDSVSSMKEVVAQVQTIYRNTENTIDVNFHESSDVDWSQTTASGLLSYVDTDGWESNWKSILNELFKNGKWSDSILEAVIGVSGALWGIDFSAALKSELLKFSASHTQKSNLNFDKGEVNFEDKFKAAFEAAKLTGKGEYGWLSGEVSLAALTAALQGEFECGLFKDGKFDPSIGISGKASASVVSGEAEVEFGTDDMNIGGKAKGELLTAEAEAGVTVSKDGIGAKAGAEAYLAKGEIEGGFEFFGVEVNVKAEGGAGGASAKIGGEVSDDGVSAEIGAGIGIGAGLEVEIDWSELKDNVSEVADTISDEMDGFYEDAKDAILDAIDWTRGFEPIPGIGISLGGGLMGGR